MKSPPTQYCQLCVGFTFYVLFKLLSKKSKNKTIYRIYLFDNFYIFQTFVKDRTAPHRPDALLLLSAPHQKSVRSLLLAASFCYSAFPNVRHVFQMNCLPTHLIFQMRRHTFNVKDNCKNVTNIWKHTVLFIINAVCRT